MQLQKSAMYALHVYLFVKFWVRACQQQRVLLTRALPCVVCLTGGLLMCGVLDWWSVNVWCAWLVACQCVVCLTGGMSMCGVLDWWHVNVWCAWLVVCQCVGCKPAQLYAEVKSGYMGRQARKPSLTSVYKETFTFFSSSLFIST